MSADIQPSRKSPLGQGLNTVPEDESTPIRFSVDAAMLEEIGERLVGRKEVALAELIKNSYDADATRVEIKVTDNSIEVLDNGHGMTVEEFRSRWMRIGSPHKMEARVSPGFNRTLTGAKGIGRLATQFLAERLEVRSQPDISQILTPSPNCPDTKGLFATIDWRQARHAGDLTNAAAHLKVESFPTGFALNSSHGTSVRLRRLKHTWDAEAFEALIREIWFLQPPFRSFTGPTAPGQDFEIILKTGQEEDTEFSDQMGRVMNLWTSRLSGRLDPENQELSIAVEGDDHKPQVHRIDLSKSMDRQPLLNRLDFEIRFYSLRNRLPNGVPVGQARRYLAQWSGLHIYDAGFRLATQDHGSDWLRLKHAAARESSLAQIAPWSLEIGATLRHMPNENMLGVVNVDTALESRKSKGYRGSHHLQVKAARDGLVENSASERLSEILQLALGFYADYSNAAKMNKASATRDIKPSQKVLEGLEGVLQKHADRIPDDIGRDIRTEISRTIKQVREQAEWTTAQSGLLGALATMGSTALAFDHEFNKQLMVLEHFVSESSSERVLEERVKRWLSDIRSSRTIFSPIADERNREAIGRFRARAVIQRQIEDLRLILRHTRVDISGVAESLRLPESHYPALTAIFTNVLTNAANAMLDAEEKVIHISSVQQSKHVRIRIQDTGAGADLAIAETYFEPLARGLKVTPERRALIYGGTGLGLAIVRMLATDINVNTKFTEPDEGFATCLELIWTES